jgi:hypothetical protein
MKKLRLACGSAPCGFSGAAKSTVRAGVLRALARLRERAGHLSFGDQPVVKQIQNEARSYYAMHSSLEALRTGGRSSPALSLLTRTLEERMQLTVLRLFRLLGLRYPPRDIDAAFRAYQRNRSEELINAIEFLDNILDHELKRIVLPLLDEDSADDNGLTLFGIDHQRAAAALKDMIVSGDLWLASCAVAAVGELRILELSDTVRRAARNADAVLAPVAEQALARLSSAEA